MLGAEDMVELIEALATMTGNTLITPEGVKKFGGHSWRAAGALYMSDVGVNMHKIGLMARWYSALITHYSRVAPLRSITEDYKKLINPDSLPSPDQVRQIELRARKATLAAVEERLKIHATGSDATLAEFKAKFHAIVDQHHESSLRLKAEMQDMVDRASNKGRARRFVMNRDTGCVHTVLSTFEEAGPRALTHCGWKFTSGNISMLASWGTVVDDTCSTCLPELDHLRTKKPRVSGEFAGARRKAKQI